MSEGKRGRPAVFTGKTEALVVKIIKAHGITQGQIELAAKGVAISYPTMTKLAKRHGITFSRGRPRTKA